MFEVNGFQLGREARYWFDRSALSGSADAYVRFLTAQGYSCGTIRGYVSGVAHFAQWLAHTRRGLTDINEALVARFLDKHLPSCRCTRCCWRLRATVRAALAQLLTLLRVDGLIASAAALQASPLNEELRDFERYLTQVCGLSFVTCTYRLKHIRHFLVSRFGTGPIAVSALAPRDIARFMAKYAGRWTPQSQQVIASSVQSYLRFKALHGASIAQLSAAVPKLASVRLARLPRAVSTSDITRLLAAFDCRCASSKRDYAVTRCLTDLGLRAGEIPRLTLDDIDWRHGTVQIRGKGRRIDVLPLPTRTGRAIAAYVRNGRPISSSRSLFVRHRAPLTAPFTVEVVRSIVRCAAKRAGLVDRITGSHVLRHTLVQRLLQGGATLKDIADVLRHRSFDTTTIYTKVDLPTLHQVALPWPGSRA